LRSNSKPAGRSRSATQAIGSPGCWSRAPSRQFIQSKLITRKNTARPIKAR
jgi:hypothetical protein